MSKVYVDSFDSVYDQIDADPGILHEISDRFTFEVEGAKYDKRVKMGWWDGNIRLFKPKGRLLYSGLREELLEFLRSEGHDVVDGTRRPRISVSWEEVLEFSRTLGLPHEMREEQARYAAAAISNERSILLSPTSSGKSLIIYVVWRYLGGRCLLIVPNTGLKKQFFNDLRSYGCDVGKIHVIDGPGTKDVTLDEGIVIANWQAIVKEEPEFFLGYDSVVVDEVHLASAKSLTSIMERMTETPYRIGTTGSLKNPKANRMVIVGLFGPVFRFLTTAQMIAKGQAARLKISVVLLEYPEADRKALRARYNELSKAKLKKKMYQEEMDYVLGNKYRREYVADLTAEMTSRGRNALLLFEKIEKHGKPLTEELRSVMGEDRVYYIDGSVKADDREEIRVTINQDSGGAVSASYGTCSTGISVNNLHGLIMGSPFKALNRLMQVIGRALRLGERKTEAHVVDVADDLRIGKYVNYGYAHMIERIKLYQEEGHKYVIHRVKIGEAK